jgi:L-fucose isomerase-like protein
MEALAAAVGGSLPAAAAPEPQDGLLGDEAWVIERLDALKGRHVGAVGEAPNGFTPCLYDAEQIDRLFGLVIDQMSIEQAFERINDVPPALQERAHAEAIAAQPSLASVDAAQAQTVASVEVALDAWRAERDLAGIAVRCWPEFATDLGACPCSGLGRLADRGSVMTCERDVLGAVTMLVMETLGAGSTYLVDIVDVVDDANLIRVWHCGSAATKLAADPNNATQALHCNRKLGVAGNFPLKTGFVTLARLDRDVDPSNPTGLRLIVTSGESIAAPNHFQGNTATIRTPVDARLLVNGIITGGFPHHLVVAWKDIRPELRRMAAVLGIPRIEW